ATTSPPKAPKDPPAVPRLVCAWLHSPRAGGGRRRGGVDRPGNSGRVPSRFPAPLPRHLDRRHGRHPGPPRARQGSAARLRWPAPRRPDRLPDLHLAAALAPVASGPPARQPGVVPSRAAIGQRLRVLPGLGQDRRRLLPRFPVVLEPGGVLPLCASPPELAG